MSTTRQVRNILLGAAVAASMIACLVDAFTGSILAAIPAMAAAVLVLAVLGMKRRPRDPSTHDAFVEKLVEQAEGGRKLAIYDRDTGLFAYWYMTLRGEEECKRAARHERPLTFLVVEPSLESNAWAVQGSIALWLRQHVRAVDVAGYLGNGRFLILMPETDINSAQKTVARLCAEIGDAETGLSAFPGDGGAFEELYAVAQDRLREGVDRAA
jgi:GGDEF domain-containing protein